MGENEPRIEIPGTDPDNAIVEVPITQARDVPDTPDGDESAEGEAENPTADKYSEHEVRITELERQLAGGRSTDNGAGSVGNVGHDPSPASEAGQGETEGEPEQAQDIGPDIGPRHFWFKRPGKR